MFRKVKSISLRIAVRLGFVPKTDVKAAQKALDSNGEDPTLTTLVKTGFLTPSQAEKVAECRKQENPVDELVELTKKARGAIHRMVPSR